LNWDETSHTLSVKDDGIGIPEKDIPHIFNRFYRVDESRSSVVKGSGLGLSIVQKLATLQNITLQVASREGEGTTFSLRFPF
jgi:signal transduction histidine kinase